ncbi:MAG: phosphatase PAP2 family protein [Solirubrobacteraceae bacterium]
MRRQGQPVLERPAQDRSPAHARLESHRGAPAPVARWRAIAASPVVAGLTLLVALIATGDAGVRFRDPDHVAGKYVVLVGFGVGLMVLADIAIRAGRRTSTWRPSRPAMGAVRRERWTRHRMLAAGAALISFYVTYLAYRNLKAVVPLLRPGDLFDSQLSDLDRAVFAGHDPSVLLHDILGTGLSTQVLSTFYVAFIVFLPLSLAVALVFARDLPTSLFYATAMSVNWLLGAGSYFLLPSLGPVYFDPSVFAALPHSEVTHLQGVLLDQRIGFLRNPDTGTPQAIAAFASLHIAMSFTAVLGAHVLGLGRRVKIALWAWLVITTISTVYLGWHYVIDDVAGLAIGAVGLLAARVLTGFDPRERVRAVRAA